MSDEIKKSVLNTLTEPIANSTKNITDKPTQNMGTTIADIWYLVFGGISQAADKRKLKYSYALQEFENELKEKIAKIPEDKLVEPDIQVVAKALEEAKYCVDKEELRHMFSSLISSSMNKDIYVSPTMVNIVSNLSPINAKTLSFYFSCEKLINQEQKTMLELLTEKRITQEELNQKITLLYEEHMDIYKLKNYLNTSHRNITKSLIELEHMNLICSPSDDIQHTKSIYQNVNGTFTKFENTRLSILGYNLCSICLD